MFLAPEVHENLFWPTLRAAGWFTTDPETIGDLPQLAETCLQAAYQGPFELLFYCYYAFPTRYPAEIRQIFGQAYFERVIEPEAAAEFRQVLKESGAHAVLTFNKGIFNLVAQDPVETYIERLVAGEVIHSQIKGFDPTEPIFLTYPTGWRYRKGYMEYRKESLEAIKTVICERAKVQERMNTEQFK
jgi:hypothetical protein